MSRQTKPQYFYHISTYDLGKSKIFKPKVGDFACDEPDTPRICVAPTVAHCLSSIYVDDRRHIYRTKRKEKAVYPYNVIDSCVTKEKWLLKPTKFIKVHIIPMEVSEKIYYVSSKHRGDGCLKSQRNDLKNISQILIKNKIKLKSRYKIKLV